VLALDRTTALKCLRLGFKPSERIKDTKGGSNAKLKLADLKSRRGLFKETNTAPLSNQILFWIKILIPQHQKQLELTEVWAAGAKAAAEPARTERIASCIFKDEY